MSISSCNDGPMRNQLSLKIYGASSAGNKNQYRYLRLKEIKCKIIIYKIPSGLNSTGSVFGGCMSALCAFVCIHFARALERAIKSFQRFIFVSFVNRSTHTDHWYIFGLSHFWVYTFSYVGFSVFRRLLSFSSIRECVTDNIFRSICLSWCENEWFIEV